MVKGNLGNKKLLPTQEYHLFVLSSHWLNGDISVYVADAVRKRFIYLFKIVLTYYDLLFIIQSFFIKYYPIFF